MLLATRKDLAPRLLGWYRANRRDLPWRRTRDPYAIWISEVMLQQTRVAVVIPYWERWMARFPTPGRLADAPLDDVLASWSGLGYYGRARNLHRGARAVVADHGGQLPDTAAELVRLPGIGRYTAGAVASIAFGRREPLVDGNVARVLARVCEIDGDIKRPATVRRLWQLAAELVPAEAPGDFNQALMELGATICTPASPRCDDCPLAADCGARRSGRVAQLPVVGARTADADKPLHRRRAAYLVHRGRVLLARRPPEGLFGGMWELPQAVDRAALEALVADLGVDAELGRRAVHRHRQVLSHRRLAIDVYAGRVARSGRVRPAGAYDGAAWHPLASPASLGLARASRSILERLEHLTGSKEQPWIEKPPPSASSRRGTRRSSRG